MAAYQSVLKITKKGFSLSGTVLKVIAMLSMTLDHFAVIIIKNGKLYGFSEEYYQMALSTAEGQQWHMLYEVLVLCGRIAFPIFAFLLVEGFIHTSDFWHYFCRVFFMALASELPYDLAFYNSTYNFEAQNVGFTLAVGLLVMYCMRLAGRYGEWKLISVAVGCAAAEFLNFDYGALGVLMMALFYYFKNESTLRIVSGAAISALDSYDVHCLSALAFLPILFYNGERGRFHSRWFFYMYYPLHLAVMYIMIYVGAMMQ